MTVKEEIRFCKSKKAQEYAYKISSFYRNKRQQTGGEPLQGTYRWDAYPGIFTVEDFNMKCGFLRVFPNPDELSDIDGITIEEQMELGFILKKREMEQQ